MARQAVIWEEGHGSRTRVLALLSAAGQAGAFGGLLLAVDFRAACIAGAAVFVLVLAGHAWLMPQHIPGRVRTRQRGGTRALLRNRRFLALCCAYGAYLLAYNQLHLALPAEVQRASGSQAALSWLFVLSSLLRGAHHRARLSALRQRELLFDEQGLLRARGMITSSTRLPVYPPSAQTRQMSRRSRCSRPTAASRSPTFAAVTGTPGRSRTARLAVRTHLIAAKRAGEVEYAPA